MHVKLENETRFKNDESKNSKTKEPTLENDDTKSKKSKTVRACSQFLTTIIEPKGPRQNN